MKKTLFTIALLALMMIATSAINKGAVGTNVGEYPPMLQVSNQYGDIDLSQIRGNYVLLTFWSSSDAQSRIECNKYSSWIEDNDDIRHIVVNFDSEKELFEEIAKRDGLNASAQYNVQGEVARQIVRDFRLANGLGTFLIDPDGKIAEINPSFQELSSL